MRVILEVHSGPLTGKKIWLRSGQRVAVGRTEGSECVIPNDGQISGRHFAIECSSGECLVRDLGSSNGTFLNGQRVEEAVVQNRDRIMAGQTTFVVLIENNSSITPPKTPPPELAVQSSPSSPAVAVVATALPSNLISPLSPKGKTVTSIPQPYDAGISDKDSRVRREALYAAAWTRQRWLLDHCRSKEQSPSPDHWDAILLLAILGQPSDLQRILTIGKQVSLGPPRFQVLALFGHPEVVEPILKALGGTDPEAAIAAGVAFAKITGVQIGMESSPIPVAERARKYWMEVRGQFASGSRWSRGVDVSRPLTAEMLEQLDMESRWEACFRGNYAGTWNGSLMDLEAFPQHQRLIG